MRHGVDSGCGVGRAIGWEWLEAETFVPGRPGMIEQIAGQAMVGRWRDEENGLRVPVEDAVSFAGLIEHEFEATIIVEHDSQRLACQGMLVGANHGQRVKRGRGHIQRRLTAS